MRLIQPHSSSGILSPMAGTHNQVAVFYSWQLDVAFGPPVSDGPVYILC